MKVRSKRRRCVKWNDRPLYAQRHLPHAGKGGGSLRSRRRRQGQSRSKHETLNLTAREKADLSSDEGLDEPRVDFAIPRCPTRSGGLVCIFKYLMGWILVALIQKAWGVEYEVDQRDRAFSTVYLKVKVGDSVSFVNKIPIFTTSFLCRKRSRSILGPTSRETPQSDISIKRGRCSSSVRSIRS